MAIWLFPSLFPSSREKGAEAERALINFFLLKLKSYIKTLFPTHFPDITALLFLEVGEREDNRTIKYQIYPDYNWEEESYKPIPDCYNQQKRLEHQQISINGWNINVMTGKWTVSQLFHILLLFMTNLIRVKSKTGVQTKYEYGT